jgi:hypothetical protein
MKSSNDISGLFKMLGENPEHYQEIVRDVDAQKSRERWPLLAAIQASEAAPSAPGLRRSARELPRRQSLSPSPSLEDRGLPAPQAPVIRSPLYRNMQPQIPANSPRQMPDQLSSLFNRLSDSLPRQDQPVIRKKASIFERLIR